MGRQSPAEANRFPYQEPHGPVAAPRLLERAIGREVRRQREASGVTLADLARGSGLSPGMLSKIENGAISASLASLNAVAQALHVPISSFFRGFDETRTATYVPAGQGLTIERRGTRAGHQYRLLGHVPGGPLMVEPYLITLTERSDVFPAFQHPGLEFLYMLTGEVLYRHGVSTFLMHPGDALFFEADAPHGPEELRELPITFLCVISHC